MISTSKISIYNGNWTEWSAIWSEIIHVILKLDEYTVQVQFEIMSMIPVGNAISFPQVYCDLSSE